MAYPSPSTVNATKGLGEIGSYVNEVTNNWFANMFLISIWVIVLFGYYKSKDDFAGALAVSGYTTFVIGLLFWIGGWVNGWAFGIVVAMAIIGTVVLLLDNK